MSVIDPSARPATGPHASDFLSAAAANPGWYSLGTLSTTGAIKAALEPLLAQMSADFPVGNLAAWNAPGIRCLTYLAAIINAIE